MGYYAILGVSPEADAETIKAAYRDKAKLLHPDLNVGPGAAEAFQRLAEAYHMVGHAGRRVDYDSSRVLKTLPGGPNLGSVVVEPVRCCACDRITAQPRFVVYDRVKSYLLGTRKEFVQGIFCRECAERAVIKASTVTWLLGWWGPAGPWHTIRALWRNLKGGEMPRGDNVRVLIHQCRAFLWRGDLDVARSLAEQALELADLPEHKAQLTAILDAMPDRRQRLRNRWRGWTHAHTVQAGALVSLLVCVSVGGLLLSRDTTPEVAIADIKLQPPEPGEVRHVAVDMLKVREAPTSSGPVVALLDRFATVQVADEPRDGDSWTRIVTASGVTGFVPARYLYAGPGTGPKSRWCAENKGEPPQDGTILTRRTGGEHRLTVRNLSGADAVVRLKTPTGRTQVSFFVSAGSETEITGIPQGAFRAVFATGQDYSRACGVFLGGMHSYVVPSIQIFRPGAPRTPLLVLPPPGDGPGKAKQINLEHYLDN